MLNTKAIADGLARKHGTRDPFRIAREMGFIVIFAPLVETVSYTHLTLPTT